MAQIPLAGAHRGEVSLQNSELTPGVLPALTCLRGEQGLSWPGAPLPCLSHLSVLPAQSCSPEQPLYLHTLSMPCFLLISTSQMPNPPAELRSVFVFSLALGTQRIKAGCAALDGRVLSAPVQANHTHINFPSSIC